MGWVHDWQRWQRWMQANNVVRPTIISETNLYRVAGTSEADHAAEQMRLMDWMVDEMARNELLHSVLWYADYDIWELWPWCNLRTTGQTIAPLTALGRHFVKLATPTPTPVLRDTLLPWAVR